MDEDDAARTCAREALELAGVGPEDLSVVECHDASAPAELMAYEAIGLCDDRRWRPSSSTRAPPPSAGVSLSTPRVGCCARATRSGATGIAQIVELTEQLQGRSGGRQVEGAQVGLAHNGGGTLGTDVAAMCVTVLSR